MAILLLGTVKTAIQFFVTMYLIGIGLVLGGTYLIRKFTGYRFSGRNILILTFTNIVMIITTVGGGIVTLARIVQLSWTQFPTPAQVINGVVMISPPTFPPLDTILYPVLFLWLLPILLTTVVLATGMAFSHLRTLLYVAVCHTLVTLVIYALSSNSSDIFWRDWVSNIVAYLGGVPFLIGPLLSATFSSIAVQTRQ